MSSDKATAKGSLLGAWLPKEHTTRVAEFIQRSNLRSKMADEETQAGSPPVVVPNSIEQSLRDHFERILLISEEAAASLDGLQPGAQSTSTAPWTSEAASTPRAAAGPTASPRAGQCLGLDSTEGGGLLNFAW